ncbi:MAG: formylglycine-generating enzyme family protein [Flammeovirgaceae bacterium]|nr:formylglycine-generating enzyme family protein [Flammeovirgaceae bacterium]
MDPGKDMPDGYTHTFEQVIFHSLKRGNSVITAVLVGLESSKILLFFTYILKLTNKKIMEDFVQKIGPVAFKMKFIKGDSFKMGQPDPNLYGSSWSKYQQPVHSVKVPDFYLAEYPVTQELYASVMGNNPSWFQGKNRPVEQVSWKDAKTFIEKLNNQSKKLKYRLPSESEWEYAARGGKDWEKGFPFSGGKELRKLGWYRENSHHETQDVGLRAPNQLGLYDMSGNVWEWCEDDFHESYKEAPNDGTSWTDSPKRAYDRVLRGGSWSFDADSCRVADRNRNYPDSWYRFYGFRLAASLP